MRWKLVPLMSKTAAAVLLRVCVNGSVARDVGGHDHFLGPPPGTVQPHSRICPKSRI